MNYSKTEYLVSLIDEIINNIDSREKKQRLICELNNYIVLVKKKIADQKASGTTWETTSSEKDFLMQLENLVKILEQEEIVNNQNLISFKENLNKKKPLLRAAFFTREYCLWPSFQSVWESFEKDPTCKNDLIFIPYNHDATNNSDQLMNYDYYKKNGYNVVLYKNYNISELSPDIVFYMKPYEDGHKKFEINEISRHVEHTVFISYCLDIQGGKELELYFYKLPFFYHAWRIIGYNTFYLEMMKKHGFRNAENVKLIGHPKFDYIYETINKGIFSHSDWEKKIKGRPVILWNSHFGVEPGVGVGTYFQIKDFIFQYFKKNKDMVLLWRPHPLFWNSVIQQPNVDKSAFKKMVNELIQQDNVIVDKTADYRYAFCMADALISDAATFLAEFNATGKPVMYTPKIDGEGVCDNRFIDNLYIGNSEDDINLFFDNVREGKDPKKEDRLSSFEREFGTFDGNIGKKIKEYLISELSIEKRQQAHNFVQNSFQEPL